MFEDRYGDRIERVDPVASEVWLASGEIVAADTYFDPNHHERLREWWDNWAPVPATPALTHWWQKWTR